MAEPGLPRSWREAIPYVVWIVLVLGFGLEFTTALVHGEWLRAFIAFAAMVGLMAAALHWPQLRTWAASISPNWIVGAGFALLVTLALMPFVEEKRWPFSAWFAGHLADVGAVEVEKATLIEWVAQAQKERDQATAERNSAQNGWAADRLQSQSGETHRQLVDAEAQKSALIKWLQQAQRERDEARKENDQLRTQLQSHQPTETREALCVDLAHQLLEGKRMSVGGVDYSERAKNEIREAIKSLNCPR